MSERQQSRDEVVVARLIHEKSYDAIVVKEILARANVARSTFHAHFDGKEELLLSSIRYVLAAARDQLSELSDPVDQLLYFSLPVLQHIEARRQQAPADAPRSGHRQVHRRLERLLLEQVEADIRRSSLDRAMQPELLAKHLVTTFLGVIDWWLHRRPAPSACEADDAYRALVEPVLRKNRCA